MPKVNSGNRLIQLMQDSRTGQSKLDVLKKGIPASHKDKFGTVLKDTKAEVLIEHFKDYMEAHPGEIPDLTLEKLLSFHSTGTWQPNEPKFEIENLPVEFPDTPDEVEVKAEAPTKVEVKEESKVVPVQVEVKHVDEKKDKKAK